MPYRASRPIRLQRRHFQFIADIIKDYNPDDDLAFTFALALRRTNPNFELRRFTEACGPSKSVRVKRCLFCDADQ